MTGRKSDQPSDILDSSGRIGLKGGPSFSLRHRLFRMVWNLTWSVLAAWTPPPLHPWRRLLLILFGAKLGKGARVYGSARIWYPPNLEMGDHAVIGWNVNCYCQGKITIGDYAIVSQFAHLVSGTHDIDDPAFQLFTRPIHIGRYAWVATNAFVGPGVTLEEGAVLGACAVTVKNLPAWTVHAGNPARYIRDRAWPVPAI
ncbi:putative colanic acid biosynthesis acetyltransferase WcaF [Devosia sp. YR412]|uniref:putative colanic acid biosynthesis acetyltransferase n=1 Tax=Devosia sp. YR412 TaxID=1881030 RepID=UPI0008D5C181|nr:putative colanic acid biosynthesis acetyltransferase [Devosia sp. YR412]SEQ53702.1 putative colanic acid biosynthesis acetyltransferase WcaF [Devosia sp. YR412]